MLSHGEESGRDSDERREARGEDGPPLSCLADEEDGIRGHSSQKKRKRIVKAE